MTSSTYCDRSHPQTILLRGRTGNSLQQKYDFEVLTVILILTFFTSTAVSQKILGFHFFPPTVRREILNFLRPVKKSLEEVRVGNPLHIYVYRLPSPIV